jgi:hypothetical protein
MVNTNSLSRRFGRVAALSAIAAGAAAAAWALTPVSFDAPKTFPGGTAGIVTADFNGDGKPDLATIENYSSERLQILIATSSGDFQTTATYSSFSGRPTAVAAGDFNRDGKADLVVAAGHEVDVFLSNGDGTFQSPKNYFAGGSADFVAVGDFNGDGIPDLAVANYFYHTVSVLAGKGDGSFGPALVSPAGFGPVFVVTGDFNGDGKLDLAMANYGFGSLVSGSIAILLGKGDGTFEPPVNYGAGRYAAIAMADFNGDGKPDLAVAEQYGQAVLIMLGNGDGTFQMGANYPANGAAQSLAAADFNGDGKVDLALNTGAMLLGNGDGTFHPGTPFQPANIVGYLVAGDFDRDGKQDLAATFGYGVVVLFGNGHAKFGQTVNFAAPDGAPAGIAVGDFNGDGKLDLAMTNNQSSVSIMLGDGHGSFQAGGSYPAGVSPNAIAVADFNGDGKLDLAVVNFNRSTGGVSVLLGNGDGSFQAPNTYVTGDFPSAVLVADFNNDGKLDLVVNEGWDSSIAILLGNGDGTFQAPALMQLSAAAEVAAGDFNRDGKPDLALSFLANSQTSELSILLGNGDGTFHAGATYIAGPCGGCSILAADLNADKRLDLILWDPTNTYTMLGNGDGTFQAPFAMNFGSGELLPADFNGDGKVDLATLGSLGPGIALGNGDGTFQAPGSSYYVGSPGSPLAVGDFNHDGKKDLAVGGTGVSILTNTTP